MQQTNILKDTNLQYLAKVKYILIRPLNTEGMKMCSSLELLEEYSFDNT